MSVQYVPAYSLSATQIQNLGGIKPPFIRGKVIVLGRIPIIFVYSCYFVCSLKAEMYTGETNSWSWGAQSIFWPQKAEKAHLKCYGYGDRFSVSTQFEVEVGTPAELWRIRYYYTPQHHAWSVCKLPPKVPLRHPIRKYGEKYGKYISSWDAQSHTIKWGLKKRGRKGRKGIP